MAFFRSKDEAAGYLAGMIDGEGSVLPRKTKGGNKVAIYNTDPCLIEAVGAACDLLGLPYRVYFDPPRDPKYHPKISLVLRKGHPTYVRLQALVQLRCHRKEAALEAIIARRERTLRPSKAWLEEEYVRKERSLAEIAVERGCSPPTVYHWLRNYGVPRRSLAAAAIVDWQKRKKVQAV